MSKKWSDLDEHRQSSIDNELENVTNVFDFQKEKSVKKRAKGLERFGLCSTCKRIKFARSEYTIRFAICNLGGGFSSGKFLRLNSKLPITECTEYSEVNYHPSLFEMQTMAIIIELDDKKAGF